MRRNKTQTLGDVLQEYVKALKLQGKLDEVRIKDEWNEMMGGAIANSTKEVYMKNDILFVHLKSSIIRNELFMMRSSIVNRLNEKIGKNVIREMILK